MPMKKENLPPEHLRKLIYDLKNNSQNKKIYLGALKYLPRAIYYFISNIPLNPNNNTEIPVIYHISGIFTSILINRRVYANGYKNKFSHEKIIEKEIGDQNIKNNNNSTVEFIENENYDSEFMGSLKSEKQYSKFVDVKYPIFDDDQPFYDYLIFINEDDLFNFENKDEELINNKLTNNENNELMNNENRELKSYYDKLFLNNARILGLKVLNGPEFYKEEVKKNPCIKKQIHENRIEYPFLYNKKSNVKIIPLRKMAKEVRKYKEKLYFHEINYIKNQKNKILLQKDLKNNELNTIENIKKNSSLKNLIKSEIKNLKSLGKKKNKSKKIYKELLKTKYFQKTKITWLEAGMQLIFQGHILLSNILTKKKISYLKLDNNFNLKEIRMITTKERKRSRVGQSFHILREFLKICKYIVDTYIIFKLRRINQFELERYLYTLFTNIGKYTGIYRYKYKTMKQIKKCKDIQKIMTEMDMFPYWKVWVSYFRSHISILEEYLTNLVYRMIHGRENRDLGVTKQRLESQQDIIMRQRFADCILTITPEGVKPHVSDLLKYFSEAWKYWKSNLNWDPELNEEYKKIIEIFIEEKSKRYKEQTIAVRNRIINEKIDNVVIKKNLGRITRLYIMKEIKRQELYLSSNDDTDSEFITINTALKIYQVMSEELKNIEIIKFPENEYINDHKFFSLAFKRLKNPNSLNSADQKILETFYDDSEKSIIEIKKRLLTQRIFNEIQVSLKDKFTILYPVYKIDIIERMTDAYLDQYICYELNKQNYFSKSQPSDKNIFILEIWKIIERIKLEKNDYICSTKISNIMEKIDLNLLSKLLCLILDPILVDFMISRMNCKLNYKDMQYTNFLGCIKGFEFSGFIADFYYRIVDIYLKNNFKFYYRFHNELILIFNDENFYELKNIYQSNIKEKSINEFFIKNFENKSYKNKYFSYLKNDKENLKYFEIQKFIFKKLNNLLPNSIGNFYLKDIKIRKDCFEMCNLKVYLNNKKFVISDDGIQDFINDARIILKSSSRNTFLKVVQKWNNLLLATIVYYREAITPEFIDIIRFYERKIQCIIKLGLNTKMPNRFPSVLFYAPNEIGGLGMLSIGIEDSFDFKKIKKYSSSDDGLKFLKDNSEFFNNENEIPNIMKYIKSWKREIEDSKIAYKNYKKNKTIPKDLGIPRISTIINLKDDIAFYNFGFRIRNLFKKYTGKKDNFYFLSIKHDGKLWNIDDYRKEILTHFGGIQKILQHTLFNSTNYLEFDSLFWENQVQQNLKNTKLTLAQKSGINQIPNKRFAFWWSPTINRSNVYLGYQTQIENTKISMHGKLSTIKGNYLNIFKNHLWQKIHNEIIMDILKLLDDFNTEKLIIYPKKSIRNMGGMDILVHEVDNIELMQICGCMFCINENITDNKSIKDFISDNKSIKHDINDNKSTIDAFKDNLLENEYKIKYKSIWLDIQLKWGNYDLYNISEYTKELYNLYSNNKKFYTNKYGSIICFDLCYNTFHAYGYLNKKLKNELKNALNFIHKNNRMLNILRERIRKSLQLYQQKTENVNEIKEIFNYHILDDTLKNILIFNPKTGYLLKTSRDKLLENLEILNIEKIIAKNTAPLEDTLIVNMRYEFPLYKIYPYLKSNYINVYGDWLKNNSFYTCFCRLLLILKSLKINKKIKKKIFKIYENVSDKCIKDSSIDDNCIKDSSIDNKCIKKESIDNKCIKDSSIDDNCIKDSSIDNKCIKKESIDNKCIKDSSIDDNCIKEESIDNISIDDKFIKENTNKRIKLSNNRLFIDYTDEQWIELEKEMEKIIIRDFCNKNNVLIENIPEYEIKNIIFGIKPTFLNDNNLIESNNLINNKLIKHTEFNIKRFSIVNKIGEEIETEIEKKFEYYETEDFWIKNYNYYLKYDKGYLNNNNNSIIDIIKNKSVIDTINDNNLIYNNASTDTIKDNNLIDNIRNTIKDNTSVMNIIKNDKSVIIDSIKNDNSVMDNALIDHINDAIKNNALTDNINYAIRNNTSIIDHINYAIRNNTSIIDHINDAIKNNALIDNIPINLINKFINISDLNTPLLGFVLKRKYTVIAIIPQMFANEFYLPDNLYLQDKIKAIILYNGNINLYKNVCKKYLLNVIGINIKKNIKNTDYIYNNDSIEFYNGSNVLKNVNITFNNDYAYFLVPEIWNFNFMKEKFDTKIVYNLIPGVPEQFFYGKFRKHHFN